MLEFITEIVLLFLCSAAIYSSGIVMNHISDNHKDKEWVNSLIAIFDVALMGLSIILILKILYTFLPLFLIIVSGVILLGLVILIITFIIDRISNLIKSK